MWADTNNHYGAWTYNQDTGEKIQPKGWNATLMTDDALAFLDKQRVAAKPWFLIVSWNPPHIPYDPPEEDLAAYPLQQHAFRPNLEQPTPEAVQFWPMLASMDKLRHAEQGYCGAISGIDKEFARGLEKLAEIGQAENTIVVYTSNHGDMMGSHGRMGKEVPFEESCRVQFFVRVPGVTKAATSSQELFASIDIFPTLCGLGGITVQRLAWVVIYQT